MVDEILFDGVRYIPAGQAGDFAGLTRDYVARLCKDGKILGKQVGKHWYVSAESLQRFVLEQQYARAKRKEELAAQRKREYRARTVGKTLIAASDQPRHFSQQDHKALLQRASDIYGSATAGSRKQTFAEQALRNAFARVPHHVHVSASNVATAIPIHTTSLKAHAGAQALPPVLDLLHKLTALTVAILFTLGTYMLVDTQHARIVERSSSFSESLVNATRAQLAAAAENPSGTFTNLFKGLAQGLNRKVNSLVYNIMFPASLAESTSKVVHVRVVPGGGSSNPTQLPQSDTYITQPTIERVIQEQRIVAYAGGLTEEVLDARLDELRDELIGRTVYRSQTDATHSSIENLAQDFGNSFTTNTLAATTLTVSGATSLATTTVSGQFSVSSTATSTFANGIDISDGCFAIDGNCISGGGGISLSDANVWTALQTFSAGASTTLFSSFDRIFIGDTATTTIAGSATSTFASAVQVGTGTTYLELNTSGDIPLTLVSEDSAGTTLRINSYTANPFPVIFFGSSEGTPGSPSAVGDHEILGGITATGDDGTGVLSTTKAQFLARADGDWNGSSNGTEFLWRVTAPNSTTRYDAMQLSGDGNLSVGTTTQSARLLVEGSNASSGLAVEVVNTASTTLFSIPNLSTGTSTFSGGVSVGGSFAVGGSATSTFSNGLSISDGCFAVDGACIGGGSSVALSGSNIWTALQIFSAGASSTQLSVFDIAYFGGSATTTIDSGGNLVVAGNTTLASATSTNFAITNLTNSLLATNADGSVIATTSLSSALIPDLFLRNYEADTAAGLITFTSGIISQASSTIGDGTQTGGLTILGGATTTGSALVEGTLSVGTTTANSLIVTNTSTSTFAGSIESTYLNITGNSATSTFANGLNLSGGCVSISGICIGSTAASSTLLADNNTFSGNTTLTSATSTNFAITGLTNALLATNADGSVISTSTISAALIPDLFLRNDGNDTSAGQLTAVNFVASSGDATSTFAGGLTIGSTDFVVDPDANRIGIGTNAPTTGLDVDVNTDISGDVTISGGSSLTISATGPINQSGTGQVTFGGNVNATNGLDITTANLTVGGSNFIVAPGTGNTTIAGTLAIANAINASSTLQVDSASRFYSTLRSDGTLTAAGSGTGLSVTNNATIGGTLALTGAGTFSSSLSVTGALSAATTTLSGELQLSTKKITGLASPDDSTDAANKSYVDSVAQGLELKDSVDVATTANITLSGEQSIDGVSLTAGDRVLVKDQTDKTENGIYVVAGGAWSRSADADEDSEVSSGMFTFIQSGTTNANSGWVLTTEGAITLETSLLNFTQFSGAGQIIAGTGMTKSGNTLNVIGTANRITANADSLDIASTYVGQSSITTVGTLTTGSLGNGFGNIDIGASTITGGAATFSSIEGSAITGSGNLSVSGTGSFTGDVSVDGTLSAATTTFSGDVALGGKKITGLADPTSAQEAATKAYVDAVAQGLTVKASVRVATTTPITLSGEQTIDGISAVSGDRVLVMGQGDAADNGIYIVAGGSWSRSSDADENSEVVSGMYTFVEEGTENANTGWSLLTADPITLGSTDLEFTQFSGSSEVTAGDGLTKTGNTLNVVGTAGRVTVTADAVDIASTYVGQSSITTVGTLASGSIGSTFGSINIGSSALTAGASVFSSATSYGTLSVGGTATTSIVGNSATSTFSGGITLAGGNVNVASGGAFLVNDALVLSGNTLGSGVVNSSLTSVGALDSGQITTGFGAINIGADNLNAGAAAFSSLEISGAATTSTFAIENVTSSLLSTNALGQVVATSTLGLNLIPDNFLRNDAADTATGLISFSAGASSTQLSVFDTAYFGGSATTSIASNGSITLPNAALLTAPYASSTALSVSGTAYLATASTTNLTIDGVAADSILYTDSSNQVAATTIGSSLSFSSGTLSLNAGNANTWTALQNFSAGASTTQLSALDALYIGTTATTTIQGATTGTSTFQGFINVAGTNSTSTFSGSIAAAYLQLTGSSATSTFAGGLNLTGGCLSINGTCIGGGSDSTASSTLLTDNNTFSGSNVFSSGLTATSFAASDGAATSTFAGGLTVQSTALVVQDSSGFIGIGTASPGESLTVNGIAQFGTDNASEVYLGASINATGHEGVGLYHSGSEAFLQSIDVGTAWHDLTIQAANIRFDLNGSTDNIIFTSAGDLGVGVADPDRRLEVFETVADDQFKISYDATRYADFQVDSAGDLIIDAQGGEVRLNDESLYVCEGGACPDSLAGVGNLVVENEIYISSGNNPTMGTATSTFEGDILISGKLDVGTIDPVYTIDGVKYATYGHSTIGIKEEAAMMLALETVNPKTGRYEYIIDFGTLEKGSDLWLFYQVSSFGEKWENLVISLTPGFEGQVFYAKHPATNTLTIASSMPGEVSMRLVADRYDSTKWPNLRPDQDNPYKGHVIDGK